MRQYDTENNGSIIEIDFIKLVAQDIPTFTTVEATEFAKLLPMVFTKTPIGKIVTSVLYKKVSDEMANLASQDIPINYLYDRS